jgi:hypothetical protein
VPVPRQMSNLRTLKSAFDTSTSGAERALPSLDTAGASSNTRDALGAASFGWTTTFASGRRLSNTRKPRAARALSLLMLLSIALARDSYPAVFGQLLEELAAFFTVGSTLHFTCPGRSGLDLGIDCRWNRLLGEAPRICRWREPSPNASARDMCAHPIRTDGYDRTRTEGAYSPSSGRSRYASPCRRQGITRCHASSRPSSPRLRALIIRAPAVKLL